MYNALGKPEQSIDKLGNPTVTIYDARGNVIETRYPDNTLSRTVYDADGRAYVSQDRHVSGQAANGSRSIYDSIGRVIRSERLSNVAVTISDNQSVFGGADAVISSASSTYDRAGRVILSTDAGGGTTRYEYDAAGRTVAVTDALGSRTQYFYDAAGRQTAVRDALGREVKYQYDALGRKIRTTFPDGTSASVVYNILGQKVEETDQAGLTTKFEYDAVGRLASVVKPEVTDPESGNLAAPRWTYAYDMYGRQVKITDPKGRETKFAYDELGRQRSRTLPLGQSESMQYNTLGQLSKQTDFKGQSVDFLYDSLGRPERRNYNPSTVGTPGETVQFVYDTLVRQDRVIDARGTTNYNYDLEGRLIQAQTPEGSLNYEYDAVTGRKTRTWTSSSDQRYTYDELGRLKTVGVYKRGGVSLGSPEITACSYTKVGSRESVALPNGVQTQYQYDNLNRLTSVAHYNATSELLGSYQYTLAPNGRRTAVAEQRREADNTLSTTNIAFTYDKLNRLMSEAAVSTVSARSYSSQYAYDLVGNRLSKVSAAETINYVYNANDQLENENSNVKGNVSYQYDANGCLTTKTGGGENCVYSYNLQGRMSGAVITRMESGQNVSISSTYAYDPSGIRTRAGTTVNGVVQNQVFLVDQMNHTGYAQVLEELNAAGGDAVKSYTLGDDVLSQSVNGMVSHLIYDGHGSTRMLTSASGAITDRYDYDAYGMMSGGNPGVTNPAATDFLYSGEQFDHGLQMQYLRARYYDQNTGRFNQLDPFGGNNDDPQSLHKYGYCHADPANGIDTSGEFVIFIPLALGIIFTAIAISLSMHATSNKSVPYSGDFRNKVIIITGHANGPAKKATKATIEIYKARHGRTPYANNQTIESAPVALGIIACWGAQEAREIRTELNAENNDFIDWVNDYGYGGNYYKIMPNVTMREDQLDERGQREAPSGYTPKRLVDMESEIRVAAKKFKEKRITRNKSNSEIIYWSPEGRVIKRESL